MMMRVDIFYALSAASAVVSAVAVLALVFGGEWNYASKKGLFVFWVFWGMLWASISAYHSGQTYHPCKTDFSTMKQECK